jgi:signal transduction histidine kinase
VLAAVAAVWITVDADFLAHPGWLAAQKADLILGPVFVGLYWLSRRPQSRFGPILIAVGFVGALYVLQSSSNRWLYGAGILWETVVGIAAYVLILTFPTGRLDGLASRLILLAAVLLALVPATVIDLLLPHVNAGGSISGCRVLCPENALAVTSNPTLALHLFDIFRYAVIALALATAALLIWRFVTGTPPQRRAFAIGAPVALVFLLFQATFHLLALVAPDATHLRTVVAWALVAARSAIWYGFLAALIAAQLFAARALQRLVRRALQRPEQRELEGMLREPLGDPRLRLAFWDGKTESWTITDGKHTLQRPTPDSGLDLIVVEQFGRPAVAILHDAQLTDDPELLETAGAVALLAAEAAELDTAWHDALQELRASRARIVASAQQERLRLERNLHDGAQQRLFGIQIKLEAAREQASDERLAHELEDVAEEATAAVEDLRTLARGLYPTALRERGLADGLRSIARGVAIPVKIVDRGVGRCNESVEEAVYFCALEAIQNTMKHGGPGAHATVTLERRGANLEFTIADDGAGFDWSHRVEGIGFVSMEDRIGAVGGTLEVSSEPGRGTIVRGVVPDP